MKMKSRLINVELYIRISATNATVSVSPKTIKSTSNKVTANTTAANTKAKELSVYGMIAKKAGVSTNSNGEPHITGKADADKYLKALNEYNKSNNKAAYLAGVNTSATGEPRINSAADAKAYLEAMKKVNTTTNIPKTSNGTTMGLPSNVTGEIKRYEDYRKLSDVTSNQYAMQQKAYTDDLGFRRIEVEGLNEPAYMAALGSYYTNYDSSGVVFEIGLENGNSFYCVAGDMKRDIDTNSTNQYTYAPDYGIYEYNADIIEFIMDTDNPIAHQLLHENEGGKGLGVLNYASEYKDMNSAITSITKLDIPTVMGG